MSTPESQVPQDVAPNETPVDAAPAVAPAAAPAVEMPQDVGTLQNILRSAVAKLMAHSQTVKELINANMDLRAALHLAHNDKAELEATLHGLMHPAAVAPVEAPAAEVSATDAATVSA